MEKILVTGAGGFIGYNLCNNLAQDGFEIIGVDLHYPDEDKRPYIFQKKMGDFRNTNQMNNWLFGVDAVIHLASAHLQINLDSSEYWDVNVNSLRPFLEEAHKMGVKRFIHVSTVGVYGKLNCLPAHEITPCNPQSIYGETKLEGEAEVTKFYNETGFPIVILRPAWVYGPYCPRTLKIYKSIKKKQFAMIGSGSNMRHPIFIEDLAEAVKISILNDSALGEIFIIAGEKAITTKELIQSFCKIYGMPYPKIRIPFWLGKILARGVEAVFELMRKEPPFSSRSLEFFDTDNAFDITKAKNTLGFSPRFSFEEGLKKTKGWLVSR